MPRSGPSTLRRRTLLPATASAEQTGVSLRDSPELRRQRQVRYPQRKARSSRLGSAPSPSSCGTRAITTGLSFVGVTLKSWPRSTSALLSSTATRRRQQQRCQRKLPASNGVAASGRAQRDHPSGRHVAIPAARRVPPGSEANVISLGTSKAFTVGPGADRSASYDARHPVITAESIRVAPGVSRPCRLVCAH